MSFHVCVAVWFPTPCITPALVKVLALLGRHPSGSLQLTCCDHVSQSTCTSPSLHLSVMPVPMSRLSPAFHLCSCFCSYHRTHSSLSVNIGGFDGRRGGCADGHVDECHRLLSHTPAYSLVLAPGPSLQ